MSNFLQEKEPAEIIPSSIDFKQRVPTGETVDGATSDVKVYDETGADKTTDMLVSKAVSGTIVSGIIKDGTSGIVHDVQFIAVTTPTGYKFIGHVKLTVR